MSRSTVVAHGAVSHDMLAPGIALETIRRHRAALKASAEHLHPPLLPGERAVFRTRSRDAWGIVFAYEIRSTR